MSEETIVKIGDRYEIDDQIYAVFYLSSDLVGTVNMKKNVCENFISDSFLDSVKKGNYKKVDSPNSHANVFIPEDEIKAAHEKAEILNELIEDMKPAWPNLGAQGKKLPAVDRAAEKLHISQKQTLRQLFKYLRSGCKEESLVDTRKVKHLQDSSTALQKTSAEVVTRRNEALEYSVQVFKKKRNVTTAYKRMLLTYYTKTKAYEEDGVLKEKKVPLPNAPSYNTVNRYITDNLGGVSITDYIKGEREVRNNERPLSGNQQSGIVSPGQVLQVDECEMPVDLVDGEGHVIGKPVVYCGFDPYACIILGIYIGFENNSMLGFSNLVISMLEPHENQTSTVNVHCSDYDFPSRVIPRQIYSDQGAEYTSSQMERAMGELGIALATVPAAAGSYKGGVENVFNRLQHDLKDLLINDGYILPTHEGPEKARKEACLTMEGFKEICYRLVIKLNTTSLGDKYDKPAELIDAGIPSVPADIWKYYTENNLNPIRVTDDNRMRIMFSLLSNDRKFKLDRTGLCYRKLRFFTNEDWFMSLMKETNPEYEVRYNPTDVSRVYVRYQGFIHALPLSEARDSLKGYIGNSWTQLDEYCRKDHELSKAQKKKDLEITLTTLDENEKTLSLEKKLALEEKNREDDIPLSRAVEKEKLRSDSDDAKNRLLGNSGEDQKKKKLKPGSSDDGSSGESRDEDIPGDESSESILPEDEDDFSDDDFDNMWIYGDDDAI